MYKIRRKIISTVVAFSLLINSFIPLLAANPIYAQEATSSETTAADPTPAPSPSPASSPSPSPEPEPSPSSSPSPAPTPQPSPTPEPSATPSSTLAPSPSLSPEPAPSPSATPQPLWTDSNGAYTTETLRLGTTYKFPPNEKVSLTFTKLPENPGTVTVKEHEAPGTVENAGSKDYEITSSMPNGSFSFDLTLPTNDPTKKVLTSDDGQNYDVVSNETVVSSDVVTIKGITHLTHFVVADETADFNHPVINEFVSNDSTEWVELYNPTAESIDLFGWELKELTDPDGTPTESLFVNDGLSGTIASKGFLVFTGTNLNNTGDWIGLYNNNGEGPVLADQVSFGNVASPYNQNVVNNPSANQSTGRIIDGGSNWTTFATPTQGVSNGATLNTLYVDLNWNSPSNDGGHTWGFDAFATIADAINFAPAGSTINVAAGTYEESITIAKSLTLSGAGSGTTTIDGCGDVITITASSVSVKGFTLTNSSCSGSGSIVYIGSSIQSINIEGNIIQDGENGIYTNGSTNTTIQNNEIRNNTYGVYVTGDVSGSQIKSNNIHDNGQGISADGASFSELSISGNQITTSSDGYGIYFNAISESVLTISQNQITGGNDSGIYLSGGGAQISGSTVTISQNTVSSNSNHGIYADVIVNSTLNVTNNTVETNDGNGIYLCAAGQCNNNSILRIKGNSISGNSNSGLSLYEIYASTVTIGGEAQEDRNTITNNGSSGIYIQYIGTPQDPSNVAILNNTISSNSEWGIYLGNFDSTSAVSANQNNILGNDVGVQNNDLQDFFDATLNFWGDASGPLEANLNPNGLGNRVAGRVLFSPFYTDSTRSTLTEIEFNAGSINLANFDDWGIFDLSEEGEDLVRFVDLLQQFEFEAIENGGENDIVLPEGVRIERSDDLEFDWDALSLQDVAESLMSGFDSTTLIVDAIQWGLPGIELEFSTPITVRIFVGTALNGQTLNVKRSTSGSGSWTSTGIVVPATCLVADGLCTFQATLASYFAATQQVAVSSSSSAGGQALSQAGGPVAAPTCNDTKPGSAPTLLNAAAGVNNVTLNWSKAKNPVTYYLVNYSTTPGKFQFGNPNVGGADTISYQVEGLSGGTTYYFKVRAGNGCAPGDYSNELAAAPRGGFVLGPAAGFATGVLGAKTKIEEQKVTATPAPAEQPESVQFEQPKVTSDNLFSRILNFVTNFFKGLFGK